MVWREGRVKIGRIVVLACCLALLALAPGRYLGEAPSGQVWLWLKADGAAEFGGAPVTWRIDGDQLVMRGAETWRLTIVESKTGTCLTGPPFKRLCLTPAPLAALAPAPVRQRPAAWIGGWRHEATGGSLSLMLTEDGRYRMQQAATGDAPSETVGVWHGTADALTLIPDGGHPLTYRARRAGPSLFIGGGDLPMEVRFARLP